MNTATLQSAPKPAQKIPETQPQKPRRNHWWLIIFAFAGIYAAFNVGDFDFLVEKDGGYDLSPQRKKKYQKESEELDNAELPENLSRAIPLIRPPGNKVDL